MAAARVRFVVLSMSFVISRIDTRTLIQFWEAAQDGSMTYAFIKGTLFSRGQATL